MSASITIRKTTWKPGRGNAAVEALLQRPVEAPDIEASARVVLEGVRARGDEAVAEYAARFDGSRISPGRFRVSPSAMRRAEAAVDPDFLSAVNVTVARVEAFARAGLRNDWEITDDLGSRMGERYRPLDRVGLYIPGGAAPLASTVLMTAPIARVAGVSSIVACTPADREGAVDPHILCALRSAGIDEVYRVGGIQAIGAMAYGTRTIPRVDKIVGPGGPYVAAAKRLVYGEVALDLVAGPSEIAILADDSADPSAVAADLLSQAEHGSGFERTLLVSSDPRLVADTAARLKQLAPTVGRGDAVRRVLSERTLLVVVDSLADGVALVDRFAPEHLELMVRAPRRWAARIRNAGAIFVGRWTPESAGDFAMGPSHVLPTGGTARFFSGLTVEDFRRRTSVMELTRRGLKALLPTIETFARVERLPAHGLSARSRVGSS